MNLMIPKSPSAKFSLRRFVALLALPLLSLGVACGGQSETVPVAVGRAAPEFALSALDGTNVDSLSLAGRPVVLNFWATWCMPCRKELPELRSLAAESGESHLQVVGIALDEDGATSVGPFVKRHGIDYLVLLGNQETFQRFNGYTIPYTLLLGADRKVLGIYRGPTTRQAIERDLNRALAVAQPSPGDRPVANARIAG